MAGIAGIISLDRNEKINKRVFDALTASLVQRKGATFAHFEPGEYALFISGFDSGYTTAGVSRDKSGNSLCLVNGILHINQNHAHVLSPEFRDLGSQDLPGALPGMWNELGNNLNNYLSGNYHFIILNREERKFILSHSHFGMLPVYYFIKDDLLVFSSRLQSFADSQIFPVQINTSAFMQYLVFNYPLSDHSFFEEVEILPAGAFISNRSGQWQKEKYLDHTSLFKPPVYNYKDSIPVIDSVLSRVITRSLSKTTPFGASLTGGWDGRLVLSYLTKNDINNFVLYSYGKKESKDVQIPSDLAKKFDFTYLPVLLDEQYSKNFEKWAEITIRNSDGQRNLLRSHYAFMAEQISEYATLVLSGNCGSNILKIIQKPGSVYNHNVIRLFRESSVEDSASAIYDEFTLKYPFVTMMPAKDKFISDIVQSDLRINPDLSKGQQFYLFLLTNIERKYFGSEIAAYSSLLTNYSPFIDIEFIENLVQTPYFGGHYPFLEENPLIRQKLSRLYAHLMVKNDRRLAGFTSDRGFPITYFLSPWGRMKGFLIKKTNALHQKKIDDPFGQKEGFDRILNTWPVMNEIVDKKSLSGIERGEFLANLVSWSRWYQMTIR